MDTYAFLHIPKTAGTAFREALEVNFGPGAVGPQLPASPQMDGARAASLTRFRILTGHISVESHTDYFPSRKIITILREPIDRCISSYWFHRSMDPSIPSEEATLARKYDINAHFNLPPDLLPLSRGYVNRMTRQLGSHVLDFDCDMKSALERAKDTLRKSLWVGFHDTLKNDIYRLRNHPDFAHLPPLQQANVTPYKEIVSPATRDTIASINSYDLALYDWAKSIFTAQSETK